MSQKNKIFSKIKCLNNRLVGMKLLFLLLMSLFLVSCNEKEEASSCPAGLVRGELSGLSYSLGSFPEGESRKIQADFSIENGKKTYELAVICTDKSLSASESLIGLSCLSGHTYNGLDDACESNTTVFYKSKSLSPEGELKILDLDNDLDMTSANLFTVSINETEVFSSNIFAEESNEKIKLNSNLSRTLNILSKDYVISAIEGDRVCFNLTSEDREHCFIKNKSVKSATSQTISSLYDDDIELNLQNDSSFQTLNFRGSVVSKQVASLDERVQEVSATYQELNYSGVFFDAEFSLEEDKSYRLELETNGMKRGSLVEVVLYRKTDFSIQNLQDGFLKKFRLDFSDESLRRKKAKFDFTVSDLEQSQELVVLIYGESQSYVRNFKISKVEDQDFKTISLFLTGSPNRSFGQVNHVPDQYVPFGMAGSFGYGSFEVYDDQADYEIYTSYGSKIKTTGTHLYLKNDLDHDADLSVNFRGSGNSAQGGDSSHYLHGTKALDSGFDMSWDDLKTDPAVATVVIHTEGGRFALDSGYLKPYSSFSDETSVGGELESDITTRFNNRIGKLLGDRVLNVQNDNDLNAPIKDPMSLSNNSTTYFPDLLSRIYVEDYIKGDGSTGTRLNSLGSVEGYDLVTPYLFYLFDDQGATWDAGGPEGALAGTFLEQRSFEGFLNYYGLDPGQDSDLDGVEDYVEYVTGHDPSNAGNLPFLDAYNLPDDNGNTLKAVTFNISKEALNFGISVYQMRHNGVESIVWSFDRGRGFESSNLVDVQENEASFSVTILADGGPLEISDMRIQFY